MKKLALFLVFVFGVSILAVSAVGIANASAPTPSDPVAWGLNSSGQLGTGNYVNSDIPLSPGGLTGFVAVSAGDYHSLALKDDGTV